MNLLKFNFIQNEFFFLFFFMYYKGSIQLYALLKCMQLHWYRPESLDLFLKIINSYFNYYESKPNHIIICITMLYLTFITSEIIFYILFISVIKQSACHLFRQMGKFSMNITMFIVYMLIQKQKLHTSKFRKLL